MSFSTAFKHALFSTAKTICPGALNKLELLANVLFHDYFFFPAFRRGMQAWNSSSLPEVSSFFAALDSESLKKITLFLHKCRIMAEVEKMTESNRGFLIDGSDEKVKQSFILPPERTPELKNMQRKYHVKGGAEALIFKHGLRNISQAVSSYLADGVFVDAGACFGDSTAALYSFNPSLTIAFEPSASSCKIFRQTMRKNKIINFELVQAGLGEKNAEITFQDNGGPGQRIGTAGTDRLRIYSLDSYLTEHAVSNIKLIKSDVEGMGLKLLAGAAKTILECRPVLSLACYHSPEELFGQYRFIKELNLSYNIRFLDIPPESSGELTMLCIPQELAW